MSSTNTTAPRETTRRRLLTCAMWGGVSLAAGALGVAPMQGALAQTRTQTPTRVKTLRIGYQKYGTLVLLRARGILEKRLADEGVAVSWLEFPAGPQLLEALNAGAVDFGTVGETPPIFAQAAGVDFVYVANEPPAPKSEAILVPGHSPLTSVAQLRGKKVALNRGSNVHYLLVRALKQAGLDYTDIHPVYLAPADARAAFTQGGIDAWVIWDPYFASIQQQTEVRVLADGTGLVDNLQFYLASRRFAKDAPRVVQAVVDSLAQVDTWAKTHPDDIARELAPITGLDVATLALAARRAAYGVASVKAPVLAGQQTIADTFSELKLIPKPIAVKDAQWLA